MAKTKQTSRPKKRAVPVSGGSAAKATDSGSRSSSKGKDVENKSATPSRQNTPAAESNPNHISKRAKKKARAEAADLPKPNTRSAARSSNPSSENAAVDEPQADLPTESEHEAEFSSPQSPDIEPGKGVASQQTSASKSGGAVSVGPTETANNSSGTLSKRQQKLKRKREREQEREKEKERERELEEAALNSQPIDESFMSSRVKEAEQAAPDTPPLNQADRLRLERSAQVPAYAMDTPVGSAGPSSRRSSPPAPQQHALEQNEDFVALEDEDEDEDSAHSSEEAMHCSRCGSQSHHAEDCPHHWRNYIYLSVGEREAELNRRQALVDEGGWKKQAFGKVYRDEEDVESAWCYQCARQGHYGDDCPKRSDPGSPSRLGTKTVFPDFDVGAKSRQNAAKRAQEAQKVVEDRESDMDDWFAKRQQQGASGTSSKSTGTSSQVKGVAGSKNGIKDIVTNTPNRPAQGGAAKNGNTSGTGSSFKPFSPIVLSTSTTATLGGSSGTSSAGIRPGTPTGPRSMNGRAPSGPSFSQRRERERDTRDARDNDDDQPSRSFYDSGRGGGNVTGWGKAYDRHDREKERERERGNRNSDDRWSRDRREDRDRHRDRDGYGHSGGRPGPTYRGGY